MPNLLIGYSDIPFNGTVISTPTLGTDYRAADAHGGARNRTVKLASSSTTSSWAWQVVDAVLPEYLYIARADLLRRGDSGTPTWELEGDDDPFFPTPDADTDTFDYASLLGPRAEDLLVPITKPAAHTCWRVTLTTTNSFKHEISKIMFGNWFNLERDPIYPARVIRNTSRAMPRALPWRFSLEWAGVTDAKVSAFHDKVLRYRDINPVVLYDTNDLIFSPAFKVLHAYIVSVEIETQWVNTNRLRMVFEETI